MHGGRRETGLGNAIEFYEYYLVIGPEVGAEQRQKKSTQGTTVDPVICILLQPFNMAQFGAFTAPGETQWRRWEV